jgi:hypothetical protein
MRKHVLLGKLKADLIVGALVGGVHHLLGLSL